MFYILAIACRFRRHALCLSQHKLSAPIKHSHARLPETHNEAAGLEPVAAIRDPPARNADGNGCKECPPNRQDEISREAEDRECGPENPAFHWSRRALSLTMSADRSVDAARRRAYNGAASCIRSLFKLQPPGGPTGRSWRAVSGLLGKPLDSQMETFPPKCSRLCSTSRRQQPTSLAGTKFNPAIRSTPWCSGDSQGSPTELRFDDDGGHRW